MGTLANLNFNFPLARPRTCCFALPRSPHSPPLLTLRQQVTPVPRYAYGHD